MQFILGILCILLSPLMLLWHGLLEISYFLGRQRNIDLAARKRGGLRKRLRTLDSRGHT